MRFAFCFIFLLSCQKAPAVVEQIAVERAGPVVSFRDSAEKLPAKIDIQEGFKKERVTIYIDGKKVFSKKVTTNRAIDLADSFEFDWKEPRIKLRIRLDGENKEWECAVNRGEGKYLGIGKLDNRIHVQQSSFPFGYM